ncbi:heme exporter protein CcmD [Seminibacterium arietis]|uniref:Heme exporter protein D n=1 Tax=Seminibacterium arietis TaxID=1173502 RepID=A0ABW3IAN7_9PAST
MFFQSWSEFLNMGGYSFYVWLSYGISFVVVMMLIVKSMLAKKILFKEIKRDLEREQRRQAVDTQRGSL